MTGTEWRMRLGLVLIALVNMLPAIEAEESWGVLAIASIAGLIGIVAGRRRGGAAMAPGAVYTFVFLSVIYLIYEMFGNHPGGTVYVLDLAHFMIFLCACKFLELRTNRDLGLVAVIAFLVLVIGAFVSGSLLFAVAVAVDVTAGVWWMLVYQMKRDEDAINQRRAKILAMQPSAAGTNGSAQTSRSPALYRPAASLAIGLLATAAVLFVAVPRGLGGSMLRGIQRAFPTNLTGFSEDVQINDAPLLESDSPVMRVRFTRGDGQVIGGTDFRPYMRGATHNFYHRDHRKGALWQRTDPSDNTIQVGSKLTPAQITKLRGLFLRHEIIQQEVWLERLEGGYLFALYPPLSIGSETIGSIRHNHRDHTLQAVKATRSSTSYVVESPEAMDARRAKSLTEQDAKFSERRRGGSQIPPSVRRLAREVARDFGDPADATQHERIASGIRDYFSGGQFTYSLEPGGGRRDEVDPIEHFLTQSRKGHCEYFASAMTLMCQAAGLPARLVTGYYCGQYNPVGAFYQFRAKDAHAWVEVNLPDKGWVVFDPSPPSDEQQTGVDLSIWSEIRRLAEYLQFEWSTFVVAFDADHRQELVAGFATWLDNLREQGRSPGYYFSTAKSFLWGPHFLSSGQRAMYWTFLALCLAFAILLLRVFWILLLMLKEYLPIGRREARRVDRRSEARFYDRLAVLLAHKGHARPRHLTPREFAADLAARFADLSDLSAITEWYYEAQFGAVRLDGDRLERVREFSRRLREEPSFGTRPTRPRA